MGPVDTKVCQRSEKDGVPGWDACCGGVEKTGAGVTGFEPGGRVFYAGDITVFKLKSVTLSREFMYTRSMFETEDMAEQGKLLSAVATLRSTFWAPRFFRGSAPSLPCRPFRTPHDKSVFASHIPGRDLWPAGPATFSDVGLRYAPQ